MKRIMMILTMAAIAATAVFAGGNREELPAAGENPLFRGGAAGGGEEVTLSGTLILLDGNLVLQVGDETYSIGGPGTRLYADDFSEGDVIEVSGILITDCPGGCDQDLDGHIFLEKVTKDGEVYSFTKGLGAGSGFGQGAGNAGRAMGPRSGNTDRPRGYRWA